MQLQTHKSHCTGNESGGQRGSPQSLVSTTERELSSGRARVHLQYWKRDLQCQSARKVNKPKMAYSRDLPKMARQQCGIMD